MTYQYSKEKGWIGYCDKCNRICIPIMVYHPRYHLSRNFYLCNIDNVMKEEYVMGRCAGCSVYQYTISNGEWSDFYKSDNHKCSSHPVVDGVCIW